ncbi:MAG: hypothetical protein WAN65_28135 [Candidatus Sulfotelmatobacter sp.]
MFGFGERKTAVAKRSKFSSASGPLDVFRLLPHMDYDNPQFIAAIKKIVKRIVASSEKQEARNKDRQSQTEQSDRPRRIIRTELATPEPITVHTKWQRVKTIAEIIGVLLSFETLNTSIAFVTHWQAADTKRSPLFDCS